LDPRGKCIQVVLGKSHRASEREKSSKAREGRNSAFERFWGEEQKKVARVIWKTRQHQFNQTTNIKRPSPREKKEEHWKKAT